MKKSRLAVSLMTAMAGGAWLTFGGMVWASGPGPQPPASLGAVHCPDAATQAPAPYSETADHFDTGPCWEEESALGGECPWMDDCDYHYDYDYDYDYDCDYAYDYEEQEWDLGENEPLEEYGCKGSYDSCDEQRLGWDACDCEYDECFGCYEDCLTDEEAEPDYADYDSDAYDYNSYDYESYEYDEYGYDEYEYGDDEYEYDEYEYDEYGHDEHGYDEYAYESEDYGEDFGEGQFTFNPWDSYEADYEYEYARPEEAYGYPEMTHESYDYDVSSDYDDYGAYDEDTWDGSAYGGYSDAYPYKEFAYPESSSEEESDPRYDDDSESASDCDGNYWEFYEWEPMYGDAYQDEYSDDYYDDVCDGYEPYDPGAEASSQGIDGGLEVFAWHPAELLLFADQEVLRTLQRLGGEPSAVRRAALNEYLEGLGWEAIDFAFRFESDTGIEVLGLADDLPSAAAFLASYRLIERGDLGMDEGVEVLRRTLEDVSLDWIEGVDEITSDVPEDWNAQQWAGRRDAVQQLHLARFGEPVLEAMVNLATRKLGGLGGTILTVTARLSELGWEPALPGPAAGRAAAASGNLHR